MSGTISIPDLCGKYDLTPASFYYWKGQVLNTAPEIFENRVRKVNMEYIRAEKDKERIFRMTDTFHAGNIQILVLFTVLIPSHL